MKKSVFWSALGLGVLLGQGCTKLDDSLYNTVVASKYTFGSNDAASLLGKAYASTRALYGNDTGYPYAGEMASDVLAMPRKVWGWDQGPRQHLHAWQATSAETGYTWAQAYVGINNCNQLLLALENNQLPLSAGIDANQLIAETRALRAFYYYLLCDMYGNVPIVTRFDVPAGFLPTQSSRADVHRFVVAELTSVIPQLTEEVAVNTYGRFTKWGAYALLAKMQLNAQVYSGTAAWQDCVAACDAIINSGKFQLAATQKANFVVQNQGSPEFVYAIPYDGIRANGFLLFKLAMNGQHQETYGALDGGGWGGLNMLPQFINSYDPDDQRLTANHIAGAQKSSSGTTLTCSLGRVSGQPFVVVNQIGSIDGSAVSNDSLTQETQGLRLGKFEFESGVALQNLSNDFPVFRYADVLMMKAECRLRLGDAATAAQLVTQVRQRNFLRAPAKAAVTGAQLQGPSTYRYGLYDTTFRRFSSEGGGGFAFGRMLDELAWEFEQEGHRRQDMIRFGAWTTKSWLSHAATNDVTRNLYPIPAAELAKNGNLRQNPGY